MRILPQYFPKNQKGQALLLVLLVMSLVLTLVLSSVSKSVTDVEVSKYEDNSIRAFDAAQAGIEKAVVGLVVQPTPVILNNEASFTVTSGNLQPLGTYIRYPLELYSGESAVFWFVDHELNGDDYIIKCPSGSCGNNIPGQFSVCWGNSGTKSNENETPAVYMEFYYSDEPIGTRNKFEHMNDLSNIKVATASADPHKDSSGGNAPRGNFSVPPEPNGFQRCSNYGIEFASGFKKNNAGDLTKFLDDNNYLLLLLKVTILYNTNIPQPVAIRMTGPGKFPSQGVVIDSTGVSGDVTRRLVLNQGFPEIPFEFSNVLYSKQSLNK